MIQPRHPIVDFLSQIPYLATRVLDPHESLIKHPPALKTNHLSVVSLFNQILDQESSPMDQYNFVSSD